MSFLDRLLTERKKGNTNNPEAGERAMFNKAFAKAKKGYKDNRKARRKSNVAKAGETYSDADYYKEFRKEYATDHYPEKGLDPDKAADSSIRKKKKAEDVEESFQARILEAMANLED